MTRLDLSGDQGPTRRRAGAMDAPATSPRDVLIIVHRPETNPGAVGHWLRANGYRLDVRCPRYGCELPETMERHAGAIVFGGPMSANDPDDYIKREIDWLDVPLRDGKPYLGICLGAQMLAKNLGAKVGFHPQGYVEVGYYGIEAGEEKEEGLPAFPTCVYQWHCEGFSLPQGAEHLAGGGVFENQAFRYGPAAYGVQFHPEMTLAMIHRWTTVAAHRFAQPGARPRHEHIEAHHMHGPRIRNWLADFMSAWVAKGAGAEGKRPRKAAEAGAPTLQTLRCQPSA
jgi:GMP synthase (glutamine-hydrolysing)